MRTRIKKLTALLAAGVMTMGLLSACGSSSSSTSDTSASDTAADSSSEESSDTSESTETTDGSDCALLKSIKDKGYILVASSNDAPFFYEDQSTGELAGVDYDILKEMMSRLGVDDIQMKAVDFSNMLTELNQGNVDIVADAMYINDDRLNQAIYSNIWYTESEAFTVKKGSQFTDKDSLKEANVGAQPGTAFYKLMEQWKADGKIKELTGFENQATLINAVNAGKIDACVSDMIVCAYTLKQNPDLDLELMQNYDDPEAVGKIGAAVRFEDKDFMELLNEQLKDMKEDGTLMKIFEKYGMNDSNYVAPGEDETKNIK